jgi:hypothetical protein
MDELIKIIIGISGTVIGGFLGYFIRTFIAHNLAIGRLKEGIRISEFNKAAADFRAAFAPAIAKFNILTGRNEIESMLKSELISQSVAIEVFRPFVREAERTEYQEAWDDYHQSHKREGVSSVYFLDYAVGEEHERFSLFKERMNAILKFTEE